MAQSFYFAVVTRTGSPEQPFTIPRSSDADAVAYAKSVAELTSGKFRMAVFRQRPGTWDRACLFEQAYDRPKPTGAFGA